MGSRPQEAPSGLTQLSSAPTRWPSGLRSALSGHELSRGSAQDSRPSPRQASSLTASPVRRSKLPPKALLSKASHHPGRALPGPQTGIPKPSPQVPCPRLSGSLEAGPTSDPGRPEVWGVPPSVLLSRSGAGAPPRSEGSPVRRPLRSGRPRLLTLEVGPEVTFAEGAEVAAQRSQVPGGGRGRDKPEQPEERAPGPAAAPHSRHPGETRAGSVAAHLLSRELQLPKCIAPRQPRPVAYNSRLPSLPSQRPARSSLCRPGSGLQGEPANRPIQDFGLSFHGHGN